MALLTTATVTKPSLILPSSFPSCNSTSSSTSTSNSSSCIRFQHQTHNISCLYLGASSRGFRRNPITIVPGTRYKVWKRHVVCMAPEEERITRRSPLDFPITVLANI
ncbi:hypothetical protein CCACVL1_28053 [Corchorus capsularis]|uniref:Uncharacterized protein n=1 Tax=Corchorus capsularis TaxID=210143 RepID=A0A1R3G7Q9_COCAP|nr:hypothetical protein CCACVL1_28053 [Corchorus capsularis]